LTGEAGLPASRDRPDHHRPGAQLRLDPHEHAEKAVARLSAGKIKGRSFRVRAL